MLVSVDSASLLGATVVGTGVLTITLASALAYVVLESRKNNKQQQEGATENANGVHDVAAVWNDKEKFPGGEIHVYYATQTGTAENFARQLEREGPLHGFYVHVTDLEDVQLESLVYHGDENQTTETSTKRVIFLTSTYGEGEPPDTAAVFVKSLEEKAGIAVLGLDKATTEDTTSGQAIHGLDYCVFGLGNRQYEHYNAMGKFFDAALARAGANRLIPVGLGNEDDDLDGDFETWKEAQLWPTLEKKYLTEGSSSVLLKELRDAQSLQLPDCPYIVEYHDKATTKPIDVSLDQVHSSNRHFFTSVDCPVTTVRELRTKEDPGSTVHVEIDISQSTNLTYTTADNLGVLPVNSSAVVQSVAESLGFDLDAVVSVKAAPNHDWHGSPFPMPISVRDVLTRYYDLTGPLRRSDLKLLASYATDVVDQKALTRMSAKEGREEFREKILDSLIGLVDLLKLCPSIHMPLHHFLYHIPFLQTRFFTISSSSEVFPKSIHLTVAVEQTKRPDGSLFKGVCSNHLAECDPSKQSMVRVFLRPSTFRLPHDTTRPIILVGPGTGIAPMRALLQLRSHQRNKLNLKVGPNILYFGCKTKSQDYIYQDEIVAFQKNGDLAELYLAFSREGKKKVYVQHLLLQNAKETWKLVKEQGAYIYVCGGVKMGVDVGEALKEIVHTEGGLSTDKAKDYLTTMTRELRYVQELWA